MKTPARFARSVTRVKGALVVLLILLSGLSVGALAGYRMILHSDWEENAPPVTVNVTILWPESSARAADAANVTVRGFNATAYGATVAATDTLGILLITRHFHGMGEYIVQIGDHGADGLCGWFYAVGPPEATKDADQAADKTRVADGDHVTWRWGCV